MYDCQKRGQLRANPGVAGKNMLDLLYKVGGLRNEVEGADIESYLRRSGSNCWCRSGGSDDWRLRTRWRDVRVTFCNNLHLFAKSSEARADSLDDCR